MPDVDVYKTWLGIPDTERPLNHYQLLRLKKFEDDPAKVRANYRKMNAHVRKYAAGEFSVRSQELLNELAKAMLALTDARRKSEYDATLGRTERAGARRSLEEILIGRKVVDSAQLAKARNYANAVGVEIHEALVQQKTAPADIVMQAYAESLGLPYVDLADIGVDEKLVPQVPAFVCRQHSCAPVMVDDGQLLMASPNPILPEAEEELRLRTGMAVRSVICTPADVNAVIAKYFPKDAAAAQMAAAAVPAAKSAAGAAASTTAAKKAAAPPADRATRKKQQILTVVMAFNFVFMAIMLYRMFLRSGPPVTMTSSLLIAIAAGAVAAGIAFVVTLLRR